MILQRVCDKDIHNYPAHLLQYLLFKKGRWTFPKNLSEAKEVKLKAQVQAYDGLRKNWHTKKNNFTKLED